MTLTAQDIALRAMTEAELQAEVVKLARSLGYGVTLSARKAMLAEAAQYGVEAPPLDGLVFHPRYSLGSEPGWPDLVLIRRRDRRLVWAELKSEKGALSPRQAEVLDLLRCLETDAPDRWEDALPPGGYVCSSCGDPVESERCFDHQCAAYLLSREGGGWLHIPRIQVVVWRPSDLSAGTIAEVLR